MLSSPWEQFAAENGLANESSRLLSTAQGTRRWSSCPAGSRGSKPGRAGGRGLRGGTACIPGSLGPPRANPQLLGDAPSPLSSLERIAAVCCIPSSRVGGG